MSKLNLNEPFLSQACYLKCIFLTEHRNMPLDDAMPFLSRNFDQFVDMMKRKISAVADWVRPDSKVTYLLNLLADGRRLSLEELEDIKTYIIASIARIRPAPVPAPPPVADHRDVGREPDLNGSAVRYPERDHHGRRSADRSDRRDRAERGALLPPPKKADLPSLSRRSKYVKVVVYVDL